MNIKDIKNIHKNMTRHKFGTMMSGHPKIIKANYGWIRCNLSHTQKGNSCDTFYVLTYVTVLSNNQRYPCLDVYI